MDTQDGGPSPPQEAAEQALWETHSSLTNLREKLVLYRRVAPGARAKFRIEDMLEWLEEASKCILQIDLLLNRPPGSISGARKRPLKPDRRKIPHRPKPTDL